MPFDGKWHFDVKSSSILTINSWIALPGATMNVEEVAELIISEDGRLTVFNPYEYIQESGNDLIIIPSVMPITLIITELLLQ